MADRTAIEWTDATWNPIVGCKVLSAGCAHCYAMTLAGGRLKNHPTRAGLTTMTSAGPVWNGDVRFNDAELVKPMAWKRPRKIFVCAHGDLFYEGVPFHWVDQVVSIMCLAPQHTFQVLTKRPERMREYFTALYAGERSGVLTPVASIDPSTARLGAPRHPLITALSGGQPLPNVWLGVSAEDQATFDERVAALLGTPAAVRFVSAEPLLAAIDMTWTEVARPRLDWLIAGGESGPKARPMHPDWVRQIRDDCAAAGVAFFFKQWGEFLPMGQQMADGAISCLDRGERPGVWDEATMSARVGKRAAGHVLDGQVHHAFPVLTEGAAA